MILIFSIKIVFRFKGTDLKKKIIIADQAKLIIKQWLETNLEQPYPSKKTIELWTKKLNITKKQLRNLVKRHRKKMKLSKTKEKVFNSDDTKLMNDFYQQNKYPQKEDFTEIENLTGKNKKQIRKWFENRRFSEQN